MRIHALSVTAFGPFADTVAVDVDDLSDAGLFLLTGPTGAGKSSVLDAVCFALYGQVPGDRQSARQLRCDRAPASRAPEVLLECSVRGRRFRFTRSPQWERPKKRGTGTTRVQAHVVVEEHRDGGWTVLTNRLDDAGLLVGDLLGMTCSQFTQVAMLPQGRFMTFLRSRSEERQKVLQTLFRTDRFERVERWLVDRRVELRRRSQAANDRVAGVLNRLQEAAGATVPDDWDLADLTLPAEEGALTAWAAAVSTRATAAAGAAAELRAATVAAADAGAAALQAGERVAALRSRGQEAAALAARLAAEADSAAADETRLERHLRAASVVGLADDSRGAAAAADQAQQAVLRDAEQVERLLGQTPDDLDAAEEQAATALAVAEAFRPRLRELDAQVVRCTELADRRLALAGDADALQAELDALPARLEAAAAELATAEAADQALPAANTEVEERRHTCRAAEELVVVLAEVAALAEQATAARETAQQLRERYLDVREARIQGMAAELAGGLAVGCACPVCGSADHPAPATAGLEAVGRAEEEAARKDHEQAEFDHQLLAEKLADLRTRQAGVEAAAAGHSPEVARQLLAEAEQRRADLRAAASRLERCRAGLEGLRADQARVTRRHRDLDAELAGLRTAHQGATEQVEQLTAELADLLAGTGAGTLDELVRHRREVRDALSTLRTARQRLAVARATAETAAQAAAAAAGQAGFADPDDAVAARLPDARAAAISSRLEQRRQAQDRAAAVLADDEVAAALEQPAPDLAALRSVHQQAQHERDRAIATADEAQRRVRRLDDLGADLARSLAAWAPVRGDLATVTALAALVEGKGPDNPQRVRLSAYVLGERLRQVVAAANERLGPMSGFRYVLEQSDDRGAGDLRGGLSLLVRDAWSGQSRDPATLSGGETFIVSLALALGLADTVCHEAGGTDIDTLFIDEGFGTLDADTLDDVMDTLDGLREGGRVVGLVSHVPELRTRIPTQLEVTKTRSGSRLRALVSTG